MTHEPDPSPLSPLSATAKILRTRAQALARVPAAAPPGGAMLELLEFRLADERYAVETGHVREVCPLKDLTPLPCTPAFVRGVVNVRGRILPVLDLKKFFDLPEKGLTDLHRIIIVRGRGLEFGLLADSIVGIKSVVAKSLQPALATFTGIRSDYLKGLGAEGVVVLELAAILRDPKIVVHEEVST